MNLEHASIIMVHANTSLMRSALPDAPTLPEPQRSQRVARVRGMFANALHRLGDAVAPAPAACNVAVCSGGPAH
ncbi:MAG TPA: hypothetical protein VF218_00185 [Acidothermaceae bacterium]|jgi:hypothetical protein